MARFQPDPARDVARLGARIEELERTVRHGKAAGNMRDLADANLAKASDGEVPVYDAGSGMWKPGAGAGIPTIIVAPESGAVDVPHATWFKLPLTENENYGGFWTFDPATDGILPAAKCIATIELTISFWFNATGVRGGMIGSPSGLSKIEDAETGDDHTLNFVITRVANVGQPLDFWAYQTNSGSTSLTIYTYPIAVKRMWII